MKLVLTVAVLSLLRDCHAQTVTDCSQLGFDAVSPFTGNYPLCGDLRGNQCCTSDYLTMTAERAAEMAFRDALREELEDIDREYSTINTNLTQYLSVQFINKAPVRFPFADQLDTSSLDSFSNTLFSILIPNFLINSTRGDSSGEAEINLIVSSFITVVTTYFGNSTTQYACIARAIRGGISGDAKAQLASTIQTIRQSASALAQIQSFLVSYRQALVMDFTPVRGCVERLAQLSFCGRCTRRIPPLCRGSCNALVRGCLSPVYSAFRRDFRQLWNISRAIISRLENTIRGFYGEQGRILTNYTDTRQQLMRVCGVPTLPAEDRSSEDDDDDDGRRLTFNSLREMLDNFDGLIEYDDKGPDFCEPISNERDYCEGERRETSSDRDCRINEICTSECRCWDGSQMRETNTPDFTRGDGVIEQKNNPAVDGLVEELIAQANEIGAATPANAFLRSEEFNAVLPEGIEIPMAEPFTGSSGAVTTVVSSVLILTAVLTTLML